MDLTTPLDITEFAEKTMDIRLSPLQKEFLELYHYHEGNILLITRRPGQETLRLIIKEYREYLGGN